MKFRLGHAALHVALVLSGFAALVYQISWTRMLQRVFGVGDLAVATVLAAFFLGLGGGSWVASRYAERIERPARVYAVLEIAIAVYAAVSPLFVPALGEAYVMVGGDVPLWALSTWRLVLSLAILLPPTLLLGATLPVVASLVSAREGWAPKVTGLYFSNTMGAVVGAGLAGLVLIPRVGARISMWVAAVGSVVAAALVFAVYRRLRVVTSPSASEADASEAEPASPRRMATWLPVVLATGTGVAALAGEVLWTRLLRTILQGTTQAFAAMLVCYLLGIAFGAWIAIRLARSRLGAIWSLAATQVGAALLTVAAMAAFPHIVRLVPLIRGELSFVPYQPLTILAVAAILLLPLALMLGTGLPLAWVLAAELDRNATRGSGRLLAANTLGGLAGSLAAGFFLVPAMGIEASLLLVAFVHLLMAGLAMRTAVSGGRPATRSFALVGPLALGVVAVLLRPTVDLPFLVQAPQHPVRAIVGGPGEQWRESVAFLREGRNSTVTLIRRGDSLGLFNDGRPESGFGSGEVGFGPELALLGGMPTIFAERTDRAMVIGFGGGHSTSVVLAGGFERVDVIELEEAIVAAARLMHQARETAFPLDDARTRLIIDDARNRLALAEPGTYDAVVSQPSHPWLAGSSALYTEEFFREVDIALTEGGVLSLWINLFRIEPEQVQAVVHTLQSVFPYVQGFIAESSSLVFCASRHAPRWDREMDERLGRIAPYLAPFQLANRPGLARVLELDSAAAGALGRDAPMVVDDRPLLEFELASLPESARVVPRDLDRVLQDTPWWSEHFAERWDGSGAAAAVIERIMATIDRPLALRRIELSLPHAGLSGANRALVEGVLAEARGDIRGALTHYDRANVPDSARRADLLRLSEAMPRRALRVAANRETQPSSTVPLLRAALAVNERWALEIAQDVAASVDEPSEQALRRVVRGELAEPCRAWRERPEWLERIARAYGEVAFGAQRCAFAADDEESAERLGTLSVRARRAAAEAAFELGERCRAGGNGGCALLQLRRALREYPCHSRAAAALAPILTRSGQRDEARSVLENTLRACQGLLPSEHRIASTARELGIDLGVRLRDPRSGPSPTSTATGRASSVD